MHRNIEGYADPTAGAAMGQLMKEYRQDRKKIWQKQYELKSRKKVYVVSQYAGDIESNVVAAIKACQFVIRNEKIPIASHLIYPQMLDDGNEAEREIGTMYGLALLAICQEVWIFQRDGFMSRGMLGEEAEAKRLGKKIKYFDIKEVS